MLELYALGMTQGEDTRVVEDGLLAYPELRQELLAIEGALEKYAMDHSVTPSEGIKGEIFHAIFPEKSPVQPPVGKLPQEFVKKPLYRIPFYWKVTAAASIVLLLGSLVMTYHYYSRYRTINSAYNTAMAAMAKDQTANKAMKRDLSVMGDKNAVPVVLKGTPHAPEALAKIYWMKNTGEVYVDPSNLPAPPPGKQYQLWAIVDGKPENGGMIQTKDGIYHIQKMKSFGHAEAFAITMEKAGGSPTPTMDEMFVMAKI
ncbi:MAG: anti-sigma factor [Bacteroidota bacterium]|nr:anti-sigma factor [Bacteroidota bacterium]